MTFDLDLVLEQTELIDIAISLPEQISETPCRGGFLLYYIYASTTVVVCAFWSSKFMTFDIFKITYISEPK